MPAADPDRALQLDDVERYLAYAQRCIADLARVADPVGDALRDRLDELRRVDRRRRQHVAERLGSRTTVEDLADTADKRRDYWRLAAEEHQHRLRREHPVTDVPPTVQAIQREVAIAAFNDGWPPAAVARAVWAASLLVDRRRGDELVDQLAEVERALHAHHRDIPPHLRKMAERLGVELTARTEERQGG